MSLDGRLRLANVGHPGSYLVWFYLMCECWRREEWRKGEAFDLRCVVIVVVVLV